MPGCYMGAGEDFLNGAEEFFGADGLGKYRELQTQAGGNRRRRS